MRQSVKLLYHLKLSDRSQRDSQCVKRTSVHRAQARQFRSWFHTDIHAPREDNLLSSTFELLETRSSARRLFSCSSILRLRPCRRTLNSSRRLASIYSLSWCIFQFALRCAILLRLKHTLQLHLLFQRACLPIELKYRAVQVQLSSVTTSRRS